MRDPARRGTQTPLGFLPGVAGAEYFPSGEMEKCRLRAPVTVVTPSGPLTALGESGQLRR